MMMANRDCVAELATLAEELGFAQIGIAAATAADGFAAYEAWLDAGYAGTMHYLHTKREQRQHPRGVLPEVKSVVMLAFDYGPPQLGKAGQGQIAAYAQRPDYHELIWGKLNLLQAWLEDAIPGTRCKGVCDTAPLLERDFARRAGLGWIGKNTMLIHPRRGSFCFLAALLTSAELPPNEPFTKHHCGTCTACLNACPTQAFPMPGVLDATKCLAYHTIELRGPIPEPYREALGDHLFGCDDCQTVCPWNRFATPNPALPTIEDLVALDLREVLCLTPQGFRERFAGTAILRTKRSGLLRTACYLLGLQGSLADLAQLEELAQQEADETIAEAARWAVACIRERTS